MTTRPLPALALVLAAALLAPGCGGATGPDDTVEPTPGGPLAKSSGPGGGTPTVSLPIRKTDRSVVVDGSSTVWRISKVAQELHAPTNAEVYVDNHGTGGGFGRYLEGEVDIVDASRDAKPAEESKARERGIEWTRFVVGHDGITVVVHPKNPFVKELTVAQLKRLYSESGAVQTWKDLDPAWPNRRIVLYSPDHDSGTYEFFVEAILGKETPPRKDVQQSADDNTLVRGVSEDADSLGYFGYAYFAANKAKLKPVAIQNAGASAAVLPGPETILNGTYAPLSRPLYIFVKNAAMRRPAVAEFVRFYLKNAADLATRAKYVPPTAEETEVNGQALQRFAKAGS